MKQSIKVLSMLALSTALFGESISERVERLEEEMKTVFMETPMGTQGAKFANGSPRPYETTWYGKAELLYWHAKAGGTEYAIALDSAIKPWSGNMKDCDFEWDLGFRVGLGRFIGSQRNWDVTLDYTQFHTSDQESTNEPNDSRVAINDTIATITGISHAKFNGHIDYDGLDLMLGKNMFLSSMVSFHPKIGLRAAWLDQKYTFKGTDEINALDTALFVAGKVFHSLHSNCDLLGIGPRIGTDMKWYIGDGFRLFADFTASLLYSNADVGYKNRTVIQPLGDDETVVKLSLKGDKHLLCPHVHFFGGLMWGTNFHIQKKDQYFEFGAGYEVEYFWRVNQTLNISDSYPQLSSSGPVRVDYKRTSEDVSFYGLTFKARLDF